MADPRFFRKTGAVTLADLTAAVGIALPEGTDSGLTIDDAAPLEFAGPSSVSFIDHRKHLKALAASDAGACFVPEGLDAADETGRRILLPCADPKSAFARAADLLYRERTWSEPRAEDDRTAVIDPGAHVDASARIGPGTRVHAGAVIGPRSEIGERCIISPGVVIGDGVTIGHDSLIGANCVIQCALLGDRVRLHPGVFIGQDGFGYTYADGVHVKIPQLGRVVIQDDVEIGAGSTIDRGASGDTVIGAGTKIDNLVQIGHNSRIGRGCILIAQSGLGGSTVLEDFVVIGGGVGTAGHLTIGMGAQVAARSGVPKSIGAGEIYGGYPAKPIMQWRREVAMLNRMVKDRPAARGTSSQDAPSQDISSEPGPSDPDRSRRDQQRSE